MRIIIDAKGLPCPKPVLLAKKELDRGEPSLCIQVDNSVAVGNLTRLGESNGYSSQVTESGGIFQVSLEKGTSQGSQPSVKEGDSLQKPDSTVESPLHSPSQWTLFVPRDRLGEGDEELGQALIRMYFYTLSQSQDLPASILFMNAGVKLPTLDDQIVEHLKALAHQGVEILVCGTCLNFYQIASQLKLGTVSNMYEIMERMRLVPKVITL